jgi:hypothetical protein
MGGSFAASPDDILDARLDVTGYTRLEYPMYPVTSPDSRAETDPDTTK